VLEKTHVMFTYRLSAETACLSFVVAMWKDCFQLKSLQLTTARHLVLVQCYLPLTILPYELQQINRRDSNSETSSTTAVRMKNTYCFRQVDADVGPSVIDEKISGGKLSRFQGCAVPP